jgi:WD repeat and SOF domain-containing protein 1
MYNSTDFVMAGEGISVWKLYCDSLVRTYDVGPDTVHSIRCRPVDAYVMAGCASDRSIFLLDTRQKAPLTKMVMSLRTNNISWYPIEAFTFIAASDDYSVYFVDMRELKWFIMVIQILFWILIFLQLVKNLLLS